MGTTNGAALAPTSTVETYLEKVGGDYVAAYQAIVAEVDDKARAVAQRSNVESRKAKYIKAIHTLDRKYLASMGKTIRGFLPLAKANAEITATTGVLTPVEAQDLMVEVLEVKRLEEIAKARREAIKARVFNSITEAHAANGVDFPEHQPGSIDVPALNFKFTREGGSRRDPILNEDKLASLVGADVWDKVTRVETIPAQEIRTFDPDLYLQVARSNPALLEQLRASLTPGDFGSSSFWQRAMEQDPTTEE